MLHRAAKPQNGFSRMRAESGPLLEVPPMSRLQHRDRISLMSNGSTSRLTEHELGKPPLAISVLADPGRPMNRSSTVRGPRQAVFDCGQQSPHFSRLC